MARRRPKGVYAPDGEKKRSWYSRRWVLYTLGGLGGTALLGALAYFQVLSYLQGDSFRQSLGEQLADTMHADTVRLDNSLSINGQRVHERGLQVLDMEGVERISVGHTDATLERAALLHRILHVSKATVETASITVDPRYKGNKTARYKKGGGLLSSLAPKTVRVDSVECKDATLTLNLSKHSFSYIGSRVTATPAKRGSMDSWLVEGVNGRMRTSFSFLKDCSVKNVRLTQKGSQLDLTECRLLLAPGEMGFKAHYDMDKKTWSADMQVNKANVERILKEDWKKNLSGQLFGRMAMSGDADGIQLAEGKMSLRNAVLEALPIISDITVGNTKPYRSLPLEEATCHISYPYAEPAYNISDAWLFDKINVRAIDGKLLIRGHVIIGTDSTLRGTLNVGIPAEMVARIPLGEEAGLLDNLFNAAGDAGYAWVTINLSGTTDEPKEDFSVRLSTILGSNLPKAMLNRVSEATRSFLGGISSLAGGMPGAEEGDEDDDTPFPAPDRLEDLQETGKKVLDKATDAAGEIIKGGLKSLF